MFFFFFFPNIKSDVLSKKVTELKLIDSDIEPIATNRDALFTVWRKIIKADENMFVLDTYSHGSKTEAEAYYSAFDYYDGNILKSRGTVYQVR